MITYNHARYIAQALDSVLMQKVNFDYEILVGEDCSTDDTRSILQQYESMFPDKLHVITSEKNVGMLPNLVRTLKSSNGEYIALLEGDDYWTAPDKLQRQVDFLDQHPECALCFHNVTAFFENGSREPALMCPPDQKELATIEDIMRVNFIPTCSAMYRNCLLPDFPDWYTQLKMGDWTLFILIAQYGKIGYINQIMGVYRQHASGTWSGRSRASQLKETLIAYDCLKQYFGSRYDGLISQKVAEYQYQLAVENFREGCTGEANRYLALSTTHFIEDPTLWQGRALEIAREFEENDGFTNAEKFLAWTCSGLMSGRNSAQWTSKLYGEWYARHAFRAHQTGDRSGVRRATLLAFQHDWRLVGNRGLLSIFVDSVF
jgi:glycosyltransferase involved in cell wall biosynthesis